MAEDEDEPPVNETTTYEILPDDMVINCLARISRLYYPALSLVSKRFSYFLTSTELYQTRRLINRTEICLYLCLRLQTDPNRLRWFTLGRKPNSSSSVLVPVSSLPISPSPDHKPDLAAVGSNIYVIGGLIDNKESSNVMFMDCHTRTWHEAPCMQIARLNPSVHVLDGKIHVTGGSRYLKSSNWTEVFDTKTQTWEFTNIDSKYTVLDRILQEKSYCVIENVLYSYNPIWKRIEWYDHEKGLWKTLKSLENFEGFSDCHVVKLADYGGKIAATWETCVPVDNLNRWIIIWCAEIAIGKRKKGEIWGKFERIDNVYTTNEPYSIMQILSVTTI